MFLVVLSLLLARLPLEELAEAAGDVVAGSASAEELEQVITLTIDALIPLDILLPGPLGRRLEEVDDVIIHRAVQHVAAIVTRRARAKGGDADGGHHGRGLFRRLFQPRQVADTDLTLVPIPAAE